MTAMTAVFQVLTGYPEWRIPSWNDRWTDPALWGLVLSFEAFTFWCALDGKFEAWTHGLTP
jgi:hypothetical protein